MVSRQEWVTLSETEKLDHLFDHGRETTELIFQLYTELTDLIKKLRNLQDLFAIAAQDLSILSPMPEQPVELEKFRSRAKPAGVREVIAQDRAERD